MVVEHTGKETVASQGRQEPCHVGTRGLRGFLCGNKQGAEAWGVGLVPQPRTPHTSAQHPWGPQLLVFK